VVQTTDPALVTTPTELELARQIHDTLYRMLPDGSLQPSLAQDAPRITGDGTELQVQLRPGATFHDGTPITADVVIASWKRLLKVETGSAYWWILSPVRGALAFRRGQSTKISGLERINRLTFRIRLRAKIPDFLEILGVVPSAPLPAKWLKAKKSDQVHPPGSGPYAWSTSQTSSEVSALEAFLGHLRGRPYLDRLLVKTYQSARAAALAFQLDEVHMLWEKPARESSNHRMVDGPKGWMVYLAINPERVEKLPQGFGRAVEQAIDRQSLVRYLIGNQGMATDEIINLDIQPDNLNALRSNPKAAKAYFNRVVEQEKGIPPVLVFLVREGQALERAIAERIQVNLVDIGVAVSVVKADRKSFASRLREKDYDFYLARPMPLFRAPELQLLGILAELRGEDEVEQYLRTLGELPNDDNRKAMIRERARRYQIRFPWIPLFRHSRRVFIHRVVRGYFQGATGLADLADVWIAD
jgi:ABC-type transport system substrate-binding protein